MYKTLKRKRNVHKKIYTKKQSGGFRYGNFHTGDILLFETKSKTKSKSRSRRNTDTK